jgi:predicted membrane-bound mannosyltransferase
MDVPHAPAEQTAGDLTLSRAVILAVLAASLMVGAFAISTQSFWIDEATSLIVAMAPNPAEAWKYAQAVGGSTIQMPLYHVYLYAWHKVFGSGEWAMRAPTCRGSY